MKSASPFWALVRRLTAARLLCERSRRRANITPRYRPRVVLEVAGLLPWGVPRSVLAQALALACPDAPKLEVDRAAADVGGWPNVAACTDAELRLSRRALAKAASARSFP